MQAFCLEEVTLGSYHLILPMQPFVKAFRTLSLKIILYRSRRHKSINLSWTLFEGLEGKLEARVTNINELLIS